MSTPRSSGPENLQTLVSWKEIAAFLGRAERTVKRWEHDRGLPVHRVPGGERGGVFAYPDEIRAWLLGELGLAPNEPPPVQQSRESAAPTPLAAPAPLPPRTPAAYHPVVEWAGIAAACLIVAVGTVLFADHSSLIASARARLTAGKSLDSAHIPAPGAESLYLQGRYQWSLRTAGSLSRSVDDYTRAIALDPRYAQAYAGLAESYELLPEYGGVDRSESFERARLAATRAIELDPRLAAGHRALAFALFWHNWNAPASDAEFKRALALAPSEPETHHWYATTLLCRQRYADAIAQADQALRLAPGNPAVAADNAWVRAGLPANRSGSIGALRELARTQPTLVKPSRYLARLELEDENYPAFLADLKNAAAISQDRDELALVDAASRGWTRGGRTGLLEGMRQVQKAAFDNGRTTGFALARTDLFLGRTDEALAYFNAAFDRNDYNLMSLPGCNCIATVAGKPDYAQLLRRIRERMQVDHIAESSDLAGASIPRRLPIPGAR
ncbi:MAG: hypothetical protein WBF42_19125 [Terracidiphilus sp.]